MSVAPLWTDCTKYEVIQLGNRRGMLFSSFFCCFLGTSPAPRAVILLLAIAATFGDTWLVSGTGAQYCTTREKGFVYVVSDWSMFDVVEHSQIAECTPHHHYMLHARPITCLFYRLAIVLRFSTHCLSLLPPFAYFAIYKGGSY